jgi:Macrocin-O-methyltransferase (TylF)
MKPPVPVPLPARWPYRADPPGRYWGAYHLYQARGGQVRLEEDIRGFVARGANDGDISRFYFFCLAFDQLTKEGVKGEFAELGVYKGNTAAVLATMARRMGTTAWILDTFEGFNPADLVGPDSMQKTQFADTSLEAVRALVGEENVRYVRGYFPDSASQMPDGLRFAFVHIDCDLYLPISHALRYFYPRLLPGGYLVIHDYASLAWRGAEQAVDEFFSDKPEAIIPLTDGGGSVVIRKARSGGPDGGWLLQKRRDLISAEWTSAGDGGLIDLLGQGWSGAEPWGVWGIGPSHWVTLYLKNRPHGNMVALFRTGAALAGTRDRQSVRVFAGGKEIATWTFTKDANHGERSVTIPPNLVTEGPTGTVIQLEFRPASVIPVSELVPESKDERTLGLALMAMCISEDLG